MNILVLNPGSTSTRLALYKDELCKWETTLSHLSDNFKSFTSLAGEKKIRKEKIMEELHVRKVDIGNLDAIAARGGLLAPLESGVYTINAAMLKDLEANTYGEHASNLGALLADEIAGLAGIPAFIVDPPVVDEMDEIARVSGLPEIKRKSIFHTLNHKAVARTAAVKLGIQYRDAHFIVAHMGGGISVGAHKNGRVIDVNNALEGEGPMSPGRTGSLPAGDVIRLLLTKKYTCEELMKYITRCGGMYAYLGTADFYEVIKRKEKGDREAELIIRTMAYQVAREIGAMATVLKGRIHAIILTGGLSQSKLFTDLIKERVSFLGKVIVMKSIGEMTALACGALRVLKGEEKALEYIPGRHG